MKYDFQVDVSLLKIGFLVMRLEGLVMRFEDPVMGMYIDPCFLESTLLVLLLP